MDGSVHRTDKNLWRLTRRPSRRRRRSALIAASLAACSGVAACAWVAAPGSSTIRPTTDVGLHNWEEDTERLSGQTSEPRSSVSLRKVDVGTVASGVQAAYYIGQVGNLQAAWPNVEMERPPSDDQLRDCAAIVIISTTSAVSTSVSLSVSSMVHTASTPSLKGDDVLVSGINRLRLPVDGGDSFALSAEVVIGRDRRQVPDLSVKIGDKQTDGGTLVLPDGRVVMCSLRNAT